MTHTIKYEQLELLSQTGKVLIAEASEVGLPPGKWPDMLSVIKGGCISLIYHLQCLEQSEGDVLFAIYTAPGSPFEIRILND